jgi:hypothetical protein
MVGRCPHMIPLKQISGKNGKKWKKYSPLSRFLLQLIDDFR